MSCSSASHSVPRCRSSAASPLSSVRPQVSPGSKSFSRNPLALADPERMDVFLNAIEDLFSRHCANSFRGAKSGIRCTKLRWLHYDPASQNVGRIMNSKVYSARTDKHSQQCGQRHEIEAQEI